MQTQSRRHFMATLAQATGAASLLPALPLLAQVPGDRPNRPRGITVLNPRARVPVGWIIDDSTCLVNLNRFAMPQFDQAFEGKNSDYHKPWREWPAEIPDAFVRKFAEWSAQNGVKGKYSIVPYPACVGRLDRVLPGWSHAELNSSLELVRTQLLPNWDIHPEMVTHTRVIDLRTGHPFPDASPRFMENWDWTTGRSADEIADYMRYALQILKNVGLPCEGLTTPGGFGNRARPQLARAAGQALRDVYKAEIPHYFRDLYDQGNQSVAPRVEYAAGLDGPNPRCVVSVVGCTGDWTGGWDCTPPEGSDRFISEDLQRGRMVDVILRGEPALMVCHWTGIYWNGRELGFQIMQEVFRRLHQRFNHLLWMKLSELARYWAAKELTTCEWQTYGVRLRAPFACPDFTIRLDRPATSSPRLRIGKKVVALTPIPDLLHLKAGTWIRQGDALTVCIALPKGVSDLELA